MTINFSIPNGKQRIIAAGLVTGVIVAVLSHGAECPSWKLGIPCPACGMSRATTALLSGDISQAFAFNVLFPYWLFIAGGVFGSFILFSLGLLSKPDDLGKRILDAIPPHVHLLLWATSLICNYINYGLNYDGLLFRIF